MPSDAEIKDALEKVKTIAMVGASPKPERPSNRVMRFLQREGYKVYPVNPGHEGETLNGEKVYAKIADIPGEIDMVDIFRRPSEAGRHVDEAIEAGAEVAWMQLDVIDEAAAERGRNAGLTVVMDHCPAIEIPKLGVRTPAQSA